MLKNYNECTIDEILNLYETGLVFIIEDGKIVEAGVENE